MVRLDAIATHAAERSEPAVRANRAPTGSPVAVTLVGAVVTNEDDARRCVRLADRTGDPLLPPRRRGVPEDGWDDSGVELVVAPGDTRALGYATRGEPVDSPLIVEESERLSRSSTDPAADRRSRRRSPTSPPFSGPTGRSRRTGASLASRRPPRRPRSG